MSHVRRFDHVGITVADLDRATAFFVGLGLEVEGRMFMEGEFVDTVIGIPDSRSEIVMLRPPDGGAGLELSSFLRPDHQPGSPAAMSTELGLAHGLRARTGGNQRVPGRADRTTPPSASQIASSCGYNPGCSGFSASGPGGRPGIPIGGFWRSSQHVPVMSGSLAAVRVFRSSLCRVIVPLSAEAGTCVNAYVRAFQRSWAVQKRSTSSNSTSASSAVVAAAPATHQSAPGKPADA
jgi:catechol 2,3-dioxygenase-like lactoylglutathione lyase family enzyme